VDLLLSRIDPLFLHNVQIVLYGAISDRCTYTKNIVDHLGRLEIKEEKDKKTTIHNIL
jgi:hypothetical protein